MTGLPPGAVVVTTNASPPDGRRAQQATHKVSLRDAHEIDAEVVHLLRAPTSSIPDRRRLAQRLLVRWKSIAQCSPESRVAEVAAPSGATHTDFAALVSSRLGTGGGVTEHRRSRRGRDGHRGFRARGGQ